MREALNLFYRGDLELERTLWLLRRFQPIRQLPESPRSFLAGDIEEHQGFVQEVLVQ